MEQFLSNFNLQNQIKLCFNSGIKISSMKLSYLIATNKVIRDETTKMPTYVDIFTAIQLPSDSDFIYQSLTVAGRLLGVSGGDIKAISTIFDPDKVAISSVELIGTVQQGDTYITATYNPIKFEKLGRYFLKLSVNGEDLQDDDKFYFDVIK